MINKNELQLNNIIKKLGIEEKNFEKELEKVKEQEEKYEKEVIGMLYLMFKDILENKNIFIFTQIKKEQGIEKKIYKLIKITKNKIEVSSIYNLFMDRFLNKSKTIDYLEKIVNYLKKELKINKDTGFAYFKKMLDNLFNYKIVQSINYKIDLSKREKINYDIVKNSIDEKELVITFNKIYLFVEKEIFKLVKENKNEYNKYIDIYKKRIFPDFDTFLDTIVYNLFSKDRRHSFIYLNVKEGFGKSFLMSIFAELNIGLQTNLENLLQNPSPLNPESFKNKILLMIDEFTTFKGKLKELNNSLILNPKNQKQTKVDLYVKLFLSKEKSESLSNIVDKQITDRIIYFNYTKNNETLQELVHKSIIDNVKMFKYLKFYIYIYFLKKIKQLKKLEEEGIELNEYINKKIFEIHNKFELKVENPDELIFDLFKSYVMSTLKYKLGDSVDNFVKNIENINEKMDFEFYNTKFRIEGYHLYFNNLKGFTQFLIENTEEYDFKKIKYKISNIDLYNVKKINKDMRFNGIPYKSYYMFDLRLLKSNIKQVKSYFELEQENERLLKENIELKEQLEYLKEIENEYYKLKEIVENDNDKKYILELENKVKQLEQEIKETKERKIENIEVEINENDIPF